jgi:DNA polymerase-3 subunit epsilon
MTFRRRYFLPLAFVCLAVSMVTAVWVIVFWHALTPAEEALFEHLLFDRFAQLLITAFLILSTLAFCLGALLHCYLIPLRRLAEETLIITTANPSHRIHLKGARSIMRLVEVINRGADRFESLNRRIREIIRLGKRRAEEEKTILAEVLAQISEPVLACNNAGKILLYNEKARRALAGDDAGKAPELPPLGLNRSIYQWLDRETLERLIRESSLPDGHGSEPPRRRFVACLSDGRKLPMTLAPMSDSTGTRHRVRIDARRKSKPRNPALTSLSDRGARSGYIP